MGTRGESMKALRWHGAGQVVLDEVPEPEPGEGQSLIKINYCGICGTDIHEFRDGPQLIRPSEHALTGSKPPVTLGHELAGVVQEHGPGTSEVPVGTRVTTDACWRCGRCAACVTGNYHLCRVGGSIGLHSDGGFAPFAVVPNYTLVPIDDRVPDQVATMTEPFAVALHGLDRGAARPGETALIFGFGPIGSAAAFVGRAMGCSVIVSETDPRRLSRAEELGFRTIEGGDVSGGAMRKVIGGGGPDLAVDSTGVPAVLADAVESVRRGGRVVMLGLASAPSSISTDRLVLFERSIVGSLGYRHDLPKVMKLFAEGQVDPASLITSVVPLDDGSATIAKLADDPGQAIKVLLEP